MSNNRPVPSSRHRAIRRFSRVSKGIWDRPLFLILFTLGLSALDAACQIVIFERAIAQSVYLSAFSACAVALILNITAEMAGREVRRWVYKLNRSSSFLSVMLITAFVLILLCSTMPKIEYGHYLAASSDTDGSGISDIYLQSTALSEAPEAGETEESDTGEGWSTVFFLCMEALATSFVCFVVSYLGNDEIEKKIRFLRLRLEELKVEENECRARLDTCKVDAAQELQELEEEYTEACTLLEVKQKSLKVAARNCLARYLGNPSATSALCEESRRILAEK